MLSRKKHDMHQSNFGWSPIYVEDNLAVMSIGLISDDPAIWRGQRKNSDIKLFLEDVYWGKVDYLEVDSPPGTSNEHITLVQCVLNTGIDGTSIIMTPQEVSLIDVRKGLSFCKRVGVNVLGVVENMSGLSQLLKDFKFMIDGSSTDVTHDMHKRECS